MGLFGSYKSSSDEELMVLIQKNNYKAFDELHQRYRKRLYYFMLKMLNNDTEKAQDFLQNLFMKLIEKPHLFDTSKKFYSWIFTVAANQCRTEFRLQKMEQQATEIEMNEFENSPETLVSSFDAGVFGLYLEKALDNLQYEQKETFMLRFQEGFSIQEIAEMMNCSVGTVKSRIYYTTRKLAIELQEFKPLLKK